MSTNTFLLDAEYFSHSRYEESSTSLIQTFSSRDSVFEKLDRPVDSLNDSRNVIDLAATSRKDHCRSTFLCPQPGEDAGALNIANHARGLNDSDAGLCEAPERRRSRTVGALDPSPCYISRLPAELHEEIISTVIDGSNAKMLSLMLVCRCWRDIIINASDFWRYLVLTKKTTFEQVDTWSRRAKGNLSTLRITHGYSFFRRPKVFLDAIATLCSKIDTLDIRGNLAVVALPPEAFQRLRLRSFLLNPAPRSAEEGQFLCSMDGSRMRALTLRSTREISLRGLPFTELDFLEISGNYSNKEAFDFIRRNPMLETLSLRNHRSTALSFRDDRDDVQELAKLSRLRLCGYDSDITLRLFRTPNLKALGLTAAINGLEVRCVDALLRSKPLHLEELSLDYCNFQADGLTSLLRELHLLRTLKLTSCISAAFPSLIAVLEALAQPVGKQEDASSLGICCPRLQHVDVSSTQELKAEPILRLVKSRLTGPPMSAYRQADPCCPQAESTIRPLPIITLNLEACPLITGKALTWLQATVPDIRCTTYRG